MNKDISRARLTKYIIIFSLLYCITQLTVSLYNDNKLSRYLWLEHKDAPELIKEGKPSKSVYSEIIRNISDHHFWILRLCIVTSFFLALYYKAKNEKKYILYRNLTISVIVILILISGVLTWSLKLIIGKARPYAKVDLFSPFSLSTRFHSFPSGHTTETFSYLTPLIYYSKRYIIKILLVSYGIVTSLTRIILSYHFITDVIFGIYITLTLGYIICYLIEKRYR